ncbi:photosystem II [Salvia divinorum]|uniref:Eukaryotic translation initiation factor 5B n=1 Tax=Salvia divinorum TaxID=28513 RepID=A0ABD1I0R0_SALDI
MWMKNEQIAPAWGGGAANETLPEEKVGNRTKAKKAVVLNDDGDSVIADNENEGRVGRKVKAGVIFRSPLAMLDGNRKDFASISKVEGALGKGKKKSSKKKNTDDDTAAEIGIGDAPSDIVQHGCDSKDKKPNSEDVASKNKKKKKKRGKNVQEEEEDLDKILAELCAGPNAAAPLEEKLQNQPSEQEEAEEEVTDVVEDNGADEDEEDEEWDAKSWDEADLKLPGKSGFSDEEVDSEPEPLPNKDMKNTWTAPQDAELHARKPIVLDEKVTSVMNYVAEGNEKNNKKEVADKQPVQNGENLRSPIRCIMGHVNAGKTKLLDCISYTHLQEGEAGRITQQIGATYLPAENIRERTKELKANAKLNVPGLLVIGTPEHESFTKLHSRGPGLCDIAVLVVDIMHGLEPQTIESLNLLKKGNTDFLIALNKVDRLYGWKTCRNAPIGMAIRQQSKDVMIEFNRRLTEIITQFKEQGISTELYYKNEEMGETYNIVPTSAISGEGVPDLLLLLVQWAQETNIKRVTYSEEVKCTVLDVVEGYVTSIDVVLVNGVLHEGDEIVVGGLQGPVVTSIRALLTPHPMRELRVMGTYESYKEIKAAQCIKIAAQGLEHAIAGASLYVVRPNDDIEVIKESAMEYVDSVMSRIDKSGEGVYVQASTLWSVEALLDFLKTPEVNIPVSCISIGAVQKMDVMKVSAGKKEYATILAYGVEIILRRKRREKLRRQQFSRVLKIMPNCVFNTKDPIVLGVHVVEGIAKIGTPICVPGREFVGIGWIVYIQDDDHRVLDYAKKGQRVTINIIGSNLEERQKMFGRHFEMENELVSKITSDSVDALIKHYSDDLSIEDRRLLWKLIELFKILSLESNGL